MQLKVYKYIEVIVHGAGSTESEKDNSYFDTYLDGLIFNYEKNNTPDEIIDLLIITPDEYYSSLLPFKDWKEAAGIRTEIVSRSTIEAAGYSWIADPLGQDWIYQGIDAYIKDYYNNVTGLTPHTPDFLLFVGETDSLTPEMPTHYWNYYNGYGWGSKSPTTDLYYTTMDISELSVNSNNGLYDLPDMFSGRISVDSIQELEIVLNKIVEYEKSPYLEQTNWYNNINLSSYFEPYNEGLPDTSDCDCTENLYFIYTSYSVGEYLSQKNYSLNKVFYNNYILNNPNDILCWEWLEHMPQGIPYYLYESDATNAVLESINNGCFLVNHVDHGSSRNKNITYNDGWLHPAFNENHIDSLSNDKMLPVMFDIDCQTGWFDGATDNNNYPPSPGNFDCLGEMLLSKENGGVVGFIGGTRTSSSGYDDELCYGFYDAIWDDFDPYNNEIQTPIYKLGAIKDYGLFYMLNKFALGNATTPYNPEIISPSLKQNRKQVEMFHVLGDPTLEMWTGVPQPLYAYVDFDENSVTIYDENDQVIPDAKVVFQYGPEATEDYEVKMTDVNGKVYSNLLNNFNVEVSALKHNYIPCYSTIISDNTTWPADEDIRGNIIITSGGNLTFGDDITLPKYSRIIVMEGGTLSTSANTGVSFSNDYSDLLVFGNLDFGQNTSFTMAGPGQGSIKLLNETTAYFFNDINFNTFKISGAPLSVSFNLSNLQNCVLEIKKANVSIATTEFDNSYVSITKPRIQLSYAHIVDNCKFHETEDAIYIDGYYNYIISGCEFYSCQDAIRIFNAGSSSTEKSITQNNIHDNSGTGLTIYHSYADVLHNLINNNGFGIKTLNRSEVHMEGDSHEVTQEIKDNINAEVYASRGSFPQYLHWNLIQDDFNEPSDPMVLYDGEEDGLDVKYNCWGNTFNPETDLSPAGSYIWEPIWKCDLGSGSGEVSEAEAMYLNARDEISNDNYSNAQYTFQEIIVQYPNTKYAQASLKELFSLEAFINNNYETLKSYYNNEPNILNNPELVKLADFLSNFCEIKLENYPTAIAWFENVIQDPESIEDSIFAIIDMGYTYYLMENGGLKSTYAGNLSEYIPASQEQFGEKRDYLLSLLPEDQKSKSLDESLSLLKPGELLQNIPNPYTGTTQIWYKLENEAVVQLAIYNNTGQLIRTIDEGNKLKGLHYINFDSSGITIGTYYYSISINGQTTDSKKMTIMK